MYSAQPGAGVVTPVCPGDICQPCAGTDRFVMSVLIEQFDTIDPLESRHA
jgi:hypothetical protein